MEQEEELVIVFSGAINDADFVRSVLEGHGFTPSMSDRSVAGWGTFLAALGGPGVSAIAVPESQAEAARQLLEHPEGDAET